MLPILQETADLVTITEEILNGKLHFLCSYTKEILVWIALKSKQEKLKNLKERKANRGNENRVFFQFIRTVL